MIVSRFFLQKINILFANVKTETYICNVINTKTKNMKLYKLKRLDYIYADIAKHLKLEIKESSELKEMLQEKFGYLYCIKNNEPKENRVKLKWRLTLPFFFILTFILMAIVLPIRWMFTGKYLIDQTKRTKWLYSWMCNLKI